MKLYNTSVFGPRAKKKPVFLGIFVIIREKFASGAMKSARFKFNKTPHYIPWEAAKGVPTKRSDVNYATLHPSNLE